MSKSTKNLASEKTQLSAFSVTNAQKPAPPKRCIKAIPGFAHCTIFNSIQVYTITLHLYFLYQRSYIYFNYLAENAGISAADYLAFWGYAASATTIIVALIGPVFGTLADTQGLKKPIFTITMLIGVLGCLTLGFARQWIAFLLIYIIAKTGFPGSLIFYDSMLGDVTTKDRMDDVSSQGYAWGYIGSCVPFIVCLGVVLGAGWIGISTEMAMMISFVIVAVWWLAATIPLLKSYKQKHYIAKWSKAVQNSFKRLGITLKNVRNEKKIFLFLLSFFFYIDLNTKAKSKALTLL